MIASRASVLARRAAAARLLSARPEPSHLAALTDVGSRRIFNEEHDMIRETARRFFADEVAPFHDEWEAQGQVTRECWLKAGELGLLCTMMPPEYGGMGADYQTATVIHEEQSYSFCSGPGFALHSEICAPYLLHYGSEEQKAKYLPKLATGEMISAIAMTEPGAGSDLQGVRTSAVDQGDHYRLSGSKTFITNGAMADVVIVVAKTDPAAGAKGISLLIVEEGMEGFQRGRKLKKLGMRAQDTSELFFDNVAVPKENLLGQEGAGFAMLMNELPQERLLIGTMGVASAEACYEATRSYVKERKAFGASIADLQVVKHRLADLKTDVVAGRVFMDHCVELHNEGRLDPVMASMAKMHGSNLQGRAADEAVQLHGGSGYMWEYPVCRAFADARVTRIYGGTDEIMRELIARTI